MDSFDCFLQYFAYIDEIDNLKEISNPSNYKSTYGNFKYLIGELFFDDFFLMTNSKQILKMKNQKNDEFIIKRSFYSCPRYIKNPLTDDLNFSGFLKDIYKEYSLNKIIWAHPCSVGVYDFKITRLIKEELIVVEFIMEYGGIDLFNSYKEIKEDGETLLKIIKQTVSVLRFVENYKIIYSDIKLSNFILDREKNIRMIDFDIAQDKNMKLETIKTLQIPKGFSYGYIAPEIYSYLNNKKLGIKKQNEYDPWKADIYSWGIMIMALLKGIAINELNVFLDQWKSNEIDHANNILSKINNIKFPNNIKITENMKIILNNCLSYNPEKRMTFKKLNELLLNIQTMDKDSLEQDIKNSNSNSFQDVNLIEKNSKHSDEINQLVEQNKILAKRCTELEAQNYESTCKINNLLKIQELNFNKESQSNNMNNSNLTEINVNTILNIPKWNNKKKDEISKNAKFQDQENEIHKLELIKMKEELNKTTIRISDTFSQTLNQLEKNGIHIKIQNFDDFPKIVDEIIRQCPPKDKLLKIQNNDIKGVCSICNKFENYASMLQCIITCQEVT